MTKGTHTDYVGLFDKEMLELNALGPYTHGVWKNNGIEIGDEEALRGRAKAIVENFYATMIKFYEISQIKEMTLCDVGCYDGYLTIEIEKVLPFKKITGIEPRKKNIIKGQKVRKFLGISTRVKFREGSIESLSRNNESFDIVFISGVFHHLENISIEIKNLNNIVRGGIFIESQCYSALTDSSILRYLLSIFNNKVIEPKDLIYQFIPKLVGMGGFKVETNYYDGSACDLAVVTIPSPNYLILMLNTYGFVDSYVSLSPKAYRKKITSPLRDFRAVCIFATKGTSFNKGIITKLNSFAIKYEKYFICHILSAVILRLLEADSYLSRFFVNLISKQFSRSIQKIIDYFLRLILPKEDIQIIKNIKYKRADKIKFELAKSFIQTKNLKEAIELLLSTTQALNCDWRNSYRSYALLSLIFRELNDSSSEIYFRELCLRANNNFPIEILEEDLYSLF